jgi:hypothetical protein
MNTCAQIVFHSQLIQGSDFCPAKVYLLRRIIGEHTVSGFFTFCVSSCKAFSSSFELYPVWPRVASEELRKLSVIDWWRKL